MKKPKEYPMNGPSLHTQRLMERPRANRAALEQNFASSKQSRPETLAILNLK